MDHNGDMTDLRQNAFKGLYRLEQLWLQGTRISSLQVGLFNGLSNLQELSLDNNQLTELQPGLFDGLESLTRIWLYKARHAHKRLYTVLPKYSKIQVLPGITSCRLVKDNKQAIELNSLLINNMPEGGYG